MPVICYYTAMVEDIIRKYGLLILFVVLLFHLLFAEGGLIGYMKIKRSVRTADASIAKLAQENAVLKDEVDKLQKDDKYLEEVVIKKYGFVRDGERLYRVEK